MLNLLADEGLRDRGSSAWPLEETLRLTGASGAADAD